MSRKLGFEKVGCYILPLLKEISSQNLVASWKEFRVQFHHLILELPRGFLAFVVSPKYFYAGNRFVPQYLNFTVQDHLGSLLVTQIWIQGNFLVVNHVLRVEHVFPQLRHMKEVVHVPKARQ